MDRWLDDAPGLAYLKTAKVWAIMNLAGDLIVWSNDSAQAVEFDALIQNLIVKKQRQQRAKERMAKYNRKRRLSKALP
jgi:hypothetical protein